MSSPIFRIGQHATLPTLTGQCTDAAGNVRSLAGATVTFTMVDSSGSPVISGAAVTVVDAASARVSFTFSAGQTATAGTFTAEFKVVYGDSTVDYFPADEKIVVKVTKSLA